MARTAHGGAFESRGRFYMRVTTAPRERPAKLLPWATDLVGAQARAVATQELVNRLRDAGQDDFVEKVVESAAAADEAKMAALARAVDGIVGGTIQSKEPKPAPDALTFKKFAESWTNGELARDFPDHVPTKKTASEDAGRLAKWVYPVVEGVALASFTLDDALEIMRRLPRSLSASSRRHVAQLVVRVLSLAVYPCRKIPSSPIPRGFLPKKGADKAFTYLYPDEDAKLLGAVGTDDAPGVPLVHRLLYGFLCREGMRSEEAQALEWRDLDLTRGAVKLDANKTDDPRSWILDPHVATALRIWRAMNPHAPERSPVFAGLITPYKLAETFRDHLKLANVDRAELFETTAARRKIRIHDCRATFVTLALGSGRTEAWVADRTGHRSSVMINRYRRAARMVEELGLGWLAPLDEAVPELAACCHLAMPNSGSEVAAAPKTTSEESVPKYRNQKKFRRRDSNPNKRIQNSEPCVSTSADLCDSASLPAANETDRDPLLPLLPLSAAASNDVVAALARALDAATAAGRFDVVAQLAIELAARRAQRPATGA